VKQRLVVQTDDDKINQRAKRRNGVAGFFDWYGSRKRKAMTNDAALSFRQFLVKIGLLFMFILVDLIFFPSIIQLFLPISTEFFVVWAIGALVLIVGEKYLLEKSLPPQVRTVNV
jgi:hypothetical protein